MMEYDEINIIYYVIIQKYMKIQIIFHDYTPNIKLSQIIYLTLHYNYFNLFIEFSIFTLRCWIFQLKLSYVLQQKFIFKIKIL